MKESSQLGGQTSPSPSWSVADTLPRLPLSEAAGRVSTQQWGPQQLYLLRLGKQDPDPPEQRGSSWWGLRGGE